MGFGGQPDNCLAVTAGNYDRCLADRRLTPVSIAVNALGHVVSGGGHGGRVFTKNRVMFKGSFWPLRKLLILSGLR